MVTRKNKGLKGKRKMSEEQKFNLIDCSGISDVANNLIDKLTSGAGWIASRKTPAKIAVNTYIEDIQNSNYDPLTKAALISRAKKTIKEYCNQKDIVEVALASLQTEGRFEEVDDDWIAVFMDKARLISNKEVQKIWGKVLAAECEDNNIPRSLIYILAQMDREDAETFTILCSLAIRVEDEYQPVIMDKKFDEYKKWGLTFDKLVSLSALGLIEMDFGPFATGYEMENTKNIKTKIVVHYFDLKCEVNTKREKLPIGNVIFTKSGQALCRTISIEKKDGFWEEYCLPLWKKDDLEKTKNTDYIE